MARDDSEDGGVYTGRTEHARTEGFFSGRERAGGETGGFTVEVQRICVANVVVVVVHTLV
jgi:hypothetical protein